MTANLPNILCFVLLCIGARKATPPFFRLLCRIATIYVAAFAVCYYFWLLSKYHAFKNHPEMIHTGISAAFVFEKFWRLFANMVLLQAIIPVGSVLLLYFAVKWLSAKTGPGTSYY